MRAFELYGGCGLGIGLEAAGIDVEIGFNKGIVRHLAKLNRRPTVEHDQDDVAEHAVAALQSSVQIVASYPSSEDEIARFILTVGAVRPEWIICIYPVDFHPYDILPLLHRYDYGVTRLTLDALRYGVPEGGSYTVTVGRLLETDDFLKEALVARQEKNNAKRPKGLDRLSEFPRIKLMKGMPRRFRIVDTDTPIRKDERPPEEIKKEGDAIREALLAACPPMLAYHVGSAVSNRHFGIEVPYLDTEFKKLLRSLKPDVSDRVIHNVTSRINRGRGLLGGRTFRSPALEIEALKQAIEKLEAAGKPLTRTSKRDVLAAIEDYARIYRHRRVDTPDLDLLPYRDPRDEVLEYGERYGVTDLRNAIRIPKPKTPTEFRVDLNSPHPLKLQKALHEEKLNRRRRRRGNQEETP